MLRKITKAQFNEGVMATMKYHREFKKRALNREEAEREFLKFNNVVVVDSDKIKEVSAPGADEWRALGLSEAEAKIAGGNQ